MYKPYFELITPSIRYDNVLKIYRSLKPFVGKYDFRWTIVFDSYEKIFFPEIDFPWIRQFSYREEKGVAGNHQRNLGMDNIDDNFYFSLDDDTIMHPDFFPELTKSINNTQKRGYLFHTQLIDNSILPAIDGQIREGKVGNQSFIIHKSLIGMNRFNIHYCADGEYIEKMYKNHKNEFHFIDKVLTWHNKLYDPNWEDFLVKDEF